MKQIFAIRDTRVGSFGDPFFDDHEELVKRGLTVAMTKEGNNLSKFPGEFDLYNLGIFNPVKAEFTLLPQPELICNLQQLYNERPNQQTAEQLTIHTNEEGVNKK